MKRFMIIATIAMLAWFGWGSFTMAQESIMVAAPATTISKTVVRGPLGFVRCRASSVSRVQACVPVQACAPVEACAPVATPACAPVAEPIPACAPVVNCDPDGFTTPVVCAPVKIKSCFTRVKKVKEVIKCRPRILPSQVIRTKTVVR